MRFIGFYNYTVILTYLSLISSILGMRFAYMGKLGLAVACLAFSGFCDMFDGVVARTKKNRTDDEKNFGIQLDSLCDVVCFGVFPAVILYFSGVNTVYGIAILIFYSLCAVIRLAFFNVLETKRQMTEGGCAKAYRGLPVTMSAIIFPASYLLGMAVPASIMIVVYYILPALTAVMFITDIRIPKLDIGKLLSKRQEKVENASVEEEEKENMKI
jgi:CDP-diacylglycerol--serine O-phosphatidyltransferase